MKGHISTFCFATNLEETASEAMVGLFNNYTKRLLEQEVAEKNEIRRKKGKKELIIRTYWRDGSAR